MSVLVPFANSESRCVDKILTSYMALAIHSRSAPYLSS